MRLTQTTPHSTAEFKRKITLLLEQLWLDLAHGDPLDADVLGRCVTMRVVLGVALGAPQRIVLRQRTDDCRRRPEVAQHPSGQHSSAESKFPDETHCRQKRTQRRFVCGVTIGWGSKHE
jgi:hypothetical protein